LIYYLLLITHSQEKIEALEAELSQTKLERDNDKAIFSDQEKALSDKLAAANEEVKLFNIFKTTGAISRDLQPQDDQVEEDEDQDSYYEPTPLSDDDNDELLSATGPRLGQRRSWLMRHSGSTPLTISDFNTPRKTTVAEECISVRDDKGYYTTYVHLDSKSRITLIKRVLSNVVGIINYKIVRVPGGGKGLESTRHFWKIAAAIHSKDSSLKIETTREFGMFGRSPFRQFILKAHQGDNQADAMGPVLRRHQAGESREIQVEQDGSAHDPADEPVQQQPAQPFELAMS